eukprot:3414987-Amphidinium_carterae.1
MDLKHKQTRDIASVAKSEMPNHGLMNAVCCHSVAVGWRPKATASFDDQLLCRCSSSYANVSSSITSRSMLGKSMEDRQ